MANQTSVSTSKSGATKYQALEPLVDANPLLSIDVNSLPLASHSLPFRSIKAAVIECYDKTVERLDELSKAPHPLIIT